MNDPGPRRDLVLVGGGHTHVLALRRLAMRPPAGVRISLISESSHTPYSGMLPGLVAGHYSFDETHIDLSRFCVKLGVRFVESTVERIDTELRCVQLRDRPAISYDLLSINTGSQPDLQSVEGAARFALPVKPISGFYRRWCELESRSREGGATEPVNIVCVGGGAGSVELALAMNHRLEGLVGVQLVCGGGLLESYNRGARDTVRRRLHEQGIGLIEQSTVVAVDEHSLETQAGHRIAYDELVWCTSAVAADWFAESGLPHDDAGFLQLEDTLLVAGYSDIFAVGDAATQVRHPRPKAGVYAVRQAPVLAHNLDAALESRSLRMHRPQRRFLSLLSLGDRLAVADRGPLWASGAWVWRWKDRIDRKFMARFSNLPLQMAAPAAREEVMHCGGCGAKLPAAMLRQVLSRLAARFPAATDTDSYSDDAAVLEWGGENALVQSVDTLREFLNDPWLMGRVSLLHALSDIYAMGATPHSALAHISLPYAAPALQERDLEQFLAGALHEMESANCRLIGGHSLEGPELSAGFTVNGTVDREAVLTKRGAVAGDKLILTAPLGTGVLFAAQQQGAADGRWIAAARNAMLQSNGPAAAIATRVGASACTDITGFGLLGHLQEMLEGQALGVLIDIEELPLLRGVRELFDAGFESSLHDANRLAVLSDLEGQSPATLSLQKILFDPQTSGGLLIAIAEHRVENCLAELQEAGYTCAAQIGELKTLEAGARRIRLLSPAA